MAEGLVDVEELFKKYDEGFFENSLKGRCDLEWSAKMTSCAGICYYKAAAPTQENGKTYPRCIIRLSAPILQYRTNLDVQSTLAHEMIHAYILLHEIPETRDGHGPVFQRYMQMINVFSGLNVTVFHSFVDEVRHLQKYVWRCNGVCRNHPPYFGYLRRAQNRKPGPSSWWWDKHLVECGGEFVMESSSTPPPENRPKRAIPDSQVFALTPQRKKPRSESAVLYSTVKEWEDDIERCFTEIHQVNEPVKVIDQEPACATMTTTTTTVMSDYSDPETDPIVRQIPIKDTPAARAALARFHERRA